MQMVTSTKLEMEAVDLLKYIQNSLFENKPSYIGPKLIEKLELPDKIKNC